LCTNKKPLFQTGRAVPWTTGLFSLSCPSVCPRSTLFRGVPSFPAYVPYLPVVDYESLAPKLPFHNSPSYLVLKQPWWLILSAPPLAPPQPNYPTCSSFTEDRVIHPPLSSPEPVPPRERFPFPLLGPRVNDWSCQSNSFTPPSFPVPFRVYLPQCCLFTKIPFLPSVQRGRLLLPRDERFCIPFHSPVRPFG